MNKCRCGVITNFGLFCSRCYDRDKIFETEDEESSEGYLKDTEYLEDIEEEEDE